MDGGERKGEYREMGVVRRKRVTPMEEQWAGASLGDHESRMWCEDWAPGLEVLTLCGWQEGHWFGGSPRPFHCWEPELGRRSY